MLYDMFLSKTVSLSGARGMTIRENRPINRLKKIVFPSFHRSLSRSVVASASGQQMLNIRE
jgi:hypothetical protein